MNNWHTYYPELSISDFMYRIPPGICVLISKYIKKGGRILEAGAGSAVESIYLSHLGYDVYGIDKDLILVERARRLNKNLQGNAKFMQMNTFKLGYKSNAFDLVFHDGVVEHYNINEIREILNEQLRVSPLIIFGVPSDKFMLRSEGEYLSGIFGDENFWSLKKWKKLLSPFKLIEIYGTSIVQPRYKRLMRNLIYLPFWFVSQKWWQKRYLPYCGNLFFVITRNK